MHHFCPVFNPVFFRELIRCWAKILSGYIIIFLLYNVYYFLEIYMNVMTRRRIMEEKDKKYIRRAHRLIEEGRMTSMDDIYRAPKISW